MRLFVAVDIDAATRQAARDLRARLRRDRPTVERALHWVDAANLHLTLQFLGERDDVDAIAAALSPRFAVPGFVLQWGTTGWLPPRGRPRVLFAAVTGGEAALRGLAAEVAERLAALGIPADDRPFTAHLTLARVRDRAEAGVVRQLDALLPREPFAQGAAVPVRDVVLYESRLSRQGPAYTARARFALA